MSTQYRGSTLRAHHFAGLLSIATGLSFVLENYSFRAPFVVLGDLIRIPVSGQDLWGYALIFLGILCLWRNLYVRAAGLIGASTVWALFGLIALWASLFSGDAATVGSYNGIVSLGVMCTCLLGATNLKRDYYRPIKVHLTDLTRFGRVKAWRPWKRRD